MSVSCQYNVSAIHKYIVYAINDDVNCTTEANIIIKINNKSTCIERIYNYG